MAAPQGLLQMPLAKNSYKIDVLAREGITCRAFPAAVCCAIYGILITKLKKSILKRLHYNAATKVEDRLGSKQVVSTSNHESSSWRYR